MTEQLLADCYKKFVVPMTAEQARAYVSRVVTAGSEADEFVFLTARIVASCGVEGPECKQLDSEIVVASDVTFESLDDRWYHFALLFAKNVTVDVLGKHVVNGSAVCLNPRVTLTAGIGIVRIDLVALPWKQAAVPATTPACVAPSPRPMPAISSESLAPVAASRPVAPRPAELTCAVQ